MKTTTRLSYAKRIERVVEFLATHLDDTLDIHRLAEEAHLSPYHFHRVYVAMMGETVTETMRRKRLHAAAVLLISSSLALAAIASRAGYTSVQAFARAFRDAYGVTPAKYRLHGQLSAALQRSIDPGRKERAMFNANDVKVKEMPAERVIAIQHAGSYQQIGTTFERLLAWAAGKGLVNDQTRTLAVYYDDPISKPANELLAEACMSTQANIEDDENVRMLTISGGKCAVFEFTGPYSDLEKPYRWLYDTWLPQSGEELRQEAPYEEYLNDARVTPPSQLRTAICIPLK
jgi:AraC family transcriptional regulator